MAILYVLGTVWLWGLIPLAVKGAYQSFSFAFIAVCRLAVGTLVFAVVQAASGRTLRGDGVPPGQPVTARLHLSARAWIFVAGVAIGGDLLLYTLGLRYTTASAATLIVSTDAVLLTLFGVLLLRERMSWLKAAAAYSAANRSPTGVSTREAIESTTAAAVRPDSLASGVRMSLWASAGPAKAFA
jgi:drug/metabolite transporter (DMT)-like permease